MERDFFVKKSPAEAGQYFQAVKFILRFQGLDACDFWIGLDLDLVFGLDWIFGFLGLDVFVGLVCSVALTLQDYVSYFFLECICQSYF